MKISSLKEMFDSAISLWCHRSSPEAEPSAPYHRDDESLPRDWGALQKGGGGGHVALWEM